jgi:hypothetical protein
MTRKITHLMAAACTVGMLTTASGVAEAAGKLLGGQPQPKALGKMQMSMNTGATFEDLSHNVIWGASGFTNLISLVCWVGGAGLGVVGIFKLKQHVDSGGTTPMKDGLVRLGAGGGLLAFPFIQQVMQGSISDGQLAKIDAAPLQIDSVVAFN